MVNTKKIRTKNKGCELNVLRKILQRILNLVCYSFNICASLRDICKVNNTNHESHTTHWSGVSGGRGGASETQYYSQRRHLDIVTLRKAASEEKAQK